MGLNWKERNRNDKIYSIIFPIKAVLLFVGISKHPSLVGDGFGKDPF